MADPERNLLEPVPGVDACGNQRWWVETSLKRTKSVARHIFTLLESLLPWPLTFFLSQDCY